MKSTRQERAKTASPVRARDEAIRTSPAGLLDVVRLTRSLHEHNLAAGAEGTVVEVLTGEPLAYLVEFSDDDGATVAELVLERDQFTVTWHFTEDRSATPQSAASR